MSSSENRSPVSPPLAEPLPSPHSAPRRRRRKPRKVWPELPPDFTRPVERWRWGLAFLLVGLNPIIVSLWYAYKPQLWHKTDPYMFPPTVGGFIALTLRNLLFYGVVAGLAWSLVRPTRDELLLRWRGRFRPIWQGFGYLFALNAFYIGFFVVFALLAYFALKLTGHDPYLWARFFQKQPPQTDKIFSPAALSHPPYLLLVVVSTFWWAGLREEFWRTFTLLTLRHLFPASWSSRIRWTGAIAISSLIFGLSHAYQGYVGMLATAILGVGLGAITWRQRSIWPSVWAHTFNDIFFILMTLRH